MKTTKFVTALLLTTSLILPGFSYADVPTTKNGITTIHLDEYNVSNISSNIKKIK